MSNLGSHQVGEREAPYPVAKDQIMSPVCPSLLKDSPCGGKKMLRCILIKGYSTFLEGFLSVLHTLANIYLFNFTSKIAPTLLMYREGSFVQGTLK